MNAKLTTSRELSSGSCSCGEEKSASSAGAVRAAVITAGLWEKTHSAQWERVGPEGVRSS